jgi:hypothetical protein
LLNGRCDTRDQFMGMLQETDAASPTTVIQSSGRECAKNCTFCEKSLELVISFLEDN